ncbi:MAG: AAA family ATPase [Clostridia bacterium]|nr:MAG: AAA family ATPase [Clostridia bacterium]
MAQTGSQTGESEPSHQCPLCQDRGLILEAGGARPCPCQGQRSLQNRFRYANLDYLLRDQTFDRFNLNFYPDDKYIPGRELTYRQVARQALEAAKNFVTEYETSHHIRGLLFTGPVGSGKTFLAAAIANALIPRRHQVLFVVVPDLLDEIKATYATYAPHGPRSGYTELELMETARTTGVLILDDLGAHNYTEWTTNKLYSILNFRLNGQLPTIITTNLTLAELDQYLGERTTSRIVQLCRAYRLFTDRDIRHMVSA